jgi:hypothetical protein
VSPRIVQEEHSATAGGGGGDFEWARQILFYRHTMTKESNFKNLKAFSYNEVLSSFVMHHVARNIVLLQNEMKTLI